MKRLYFLVLFLAAFLVAAPPATAQLHRFRVVAPNVDPALDRFSGYRAEIYDKWWKEIAACQGLPLPVIHKYVRWAHINALAFIDSDIAEAAEAAGEEVPFAYAKAYLLEFGVFVALPYKFDKEVITHEMTHFLMFWAGIPLDKDHPSPYFARCGLSPRYSGKSSGR